MNETMAVQKAKTVSYRAHDNQEVNLDITVCKNYLVRGKPELVTVQEFIFFMGVCKSKALNPFAGDCYLIKYDQSPAAIIVARGQIQTRARQQADCRGWKSGIVLRKNGKLEYREGHLILDDEELVGGWAEAKPASWDEPKRHTVSLKGYIKTTREGRVTQFWQEEKQPMMIEKVAEVQLLRTLWSKEFANLYIEEEISEGMIPQTPHVEQATVKQSTTDRINEEIRKAKEKEASDFEQALDGKALSPEDSPLTGAVTGKVEEDQVELEVRALAKTFDAKIEKEKDIASPFMNDFLFDCLEKIEASEHGSEIRSLPELKAWIMKNDAYEKFLNDLECWAERMATMAEGEDKPPAANCSKCHKDLADDEIVRIPQTNGDTMFFCIDCVPKPPPDEPPSKEPEGPEDDKPVEWKDGLDCANLNDHQIVNSFINLRTSKDPNLGLKGWIRANPGWNQCSDFVRKKLIKKWSTLYTGESLDAFMKELTGQKEKPVSASGPRFITDKQYKELYAWSDLKGIGWPRVVKYAHAKGLTDNETGPGGIESPRITEAGAAKMLADLDATFQDMLAYYKVQ